MLGFGSGEAFGHRGWHVRIIKKISSSDTICHLGGCVSSENVWTRVVRCITGKIDRRELTVRDVRAVAHHAFDRIGGTIPSFHSIQN